MSQTGTPHAWPRMSRQANSSAASTCVRLLYSDAVGFAMQEAHLLEARRVVPDEVRLHRAEDRLGRFAAAAHLAEADEPVVGLHLDDRADEAAPVAAVGVAQRRFERHGDRGRRECP